MVAPEHRKKKVSPLNRKMSCSRAQNDKGSKADENYSNSKNCKTWMRGLTNLFVGEEVQWKGTHTLFVC